MSVIVIVHTRSSGISPRNGVLLYNSSWVISDNDVFPFIIFFQRNELANCPEEDLNLHAATGTRT